MSNRASIIISTYNGLYLLQEYLSSIIEAVAYRKNVDEIILIDDGSLDETKNWVIKNYPEVNLIRLNSNKGFTFACNLGIKKSKNEIVICLNNDMKVEPNFIEPLVNHFETEDVFSVTSKILLPSEKMANEAVTSVIFYRGEFLLYWPGLDENKKFDSCGYIFYGCGGATAYCKEKFLRIGGFDELFTPYYVEDLDIAYRALKKGWKIIYEPKSVVYHWRSSTIKKGKKRKIIEKRNLFLFTWKNLTDKKLIFFHLFWLFFFIGKSIIKQDLVYLSALWRAILYLPQIISRRLKKRKEKINDREILVENVAV